MQSDASSIAPSQAETLVNDDSTRVYSATGKRRGPYKRSAWADMPGGGDGVGFVPNAPQHVPFAFTDDSIIHVTVILKPTTNTVAMESQTPKKSSILTSLKSRLLQNSSSSSSPPFKIVKMPRREYLKHFAKDRDGNHTGTEEKREWTEEMLEETFRRWKDEGPARWGVEVRSGIVGRD